MNVLRLFVVALVIALYTANAPAQESPKVEPLLPRIESPTAIAVRPSGDRERHELFVADGGTGNVLRIASDTIDKPQEVITGFDSGKAPTSLLFVNGRTLIAAISDSPLVLRAYEIPEGKPLTADQVKYDVRVSGETRGPATALTTGSLALFVVGSQVDTGWVLRSRLRGSVPGDLKPFLKIGERPTCAAISMRGWVVVGDAGKPDGSEDSRLTFHHPSDPAAETALTIEPGLLDIAAIAYSPDESLIVADSAEADPERGGIYRIDMDYQNRTIGGKAIRVLSVEHPTALSFAPDGTLYMIARDKELLRVTDLE